MEKFIIRDFLIWLPWSLDPVLGDNTPRKKKEYQRRTVLNFSHRRAELDLPMFLWRSIDLISSFFQCLKPFFSNLQLCLYCRLREWLVCARIQGKRSGGDPESSFVPNVSLYHCLVKSFTVSPWASSLQSCMEIFYDNTFPTRNK